MMFPLLIVDLLIIFNLLLKKLLLKLNFNFIIISKKKKGNCINMQNFNTPQFNVENPERRAS
jgi:hypothetical protein